MKILVFGHMYTEPIHREKFQYIAGREDFDITVVAPVSWRHTLRKFYFTAKEGENFKAIPCKISLTGNYYLFFYNNISRIIKQAAPDIIEIDQEPASLACHAIIRAAKRAHPAAKVVVWTSEDTVEKWKFPFSYFERYNLCKIDHIIACNSGAERLLRRKGYKGKISVFQMLGVNPEIFKPHDASKLKKTLGLDRKFVVGYVGRMVEGKGLFTLMRAVKSIEDAYLLLVGSGNLVPELLDFAKSSGIYDRVVYVSVVRHLDIPAYMNCMDVFVLPSEGTKSWQEKFGYVIPQAMCCKVPVIGSRNGGIPEVIKDAGLLFKPKDHAELALKLRSLKEDKVLAGMLAEKGRNRSLENFTVENIAGRIAGVYRETIR